MQPRVYRALRDLEHLGEFGPVVVLDVSSFRQHLQIEGQVVQGDLDPADAALERELPTQ